LEEEKSFIKSKEGEKGGGGERNLYPLPGKRKGGEGV